MQLVPDRNLARQVQKGADDRYKVAFDLEVTLEAVPEQILVRVAEDAPVPTLDLVLRANREPAPIPALGSPADCGRGPILLGPGALAPDLALVGSLNDLTHFHLWIALQTQKRIYGCSLLTIVR